MNHLFGKTNKFRLFSAILIFSCVTTASVESSEIQRPMLKSVKFPKTGIKSITKETVACPIEESDTTVRIGLSGRSKIYVKDCFLSGSGRGHTISIGISDSNLSKPQRSVKLSTSTLGWITLRDFNGDGLPWLQDIDNDRIPEVIIWQSFSDSKYFSTSSSGLIPFAYNLKGQELILNKSASCFMIEETKRNYQSTIIFLSENMGKSWRDLDLYNRILRILNKTQSSLCPGINGKTDK
jgi:hypothetical protein